MTRVRAECDDLIYKSSLLRDIFSNVVLLIDTRVFPLSRLTRTKSPSVRVLVSLQLHSNTN